MSEAEIARLREEIADVDKELVGLIAKRLHLAGQLGLEKKLLGHPIDDEGANDLVHTWLVAEFATRGIGPTFSEGLATLLIDESVRREKSVRRPIPIHQRVLVVGGAGQMGRWLCRYLRSRGCDVVVNDIAGPLEGFPFEPDLTKGVREADVVAVSVPMSVTAEVLRSISAMKPSALIFDITSLKAPVVEVLRQMGHAGLRITSVHPMFGPNLWPLSSGNITFSDCGNGVAVLEAKELFRASGASFVDLSLDHHDEFMEFLLGLSHLCLLTFARCVARSPFDLAGLRRPEGTTFSRLSIAAAGLLADPPALLRDIQALNPHTPFVHHRIRETLDEWQRATVAPDGAEFFRLIEQTRAYFQAGKPP
ncbi:MAG TPA: prephenate dehydrogenase/arogenate dehydrogenase family protein [Thermoplasmata archaeon]|nr:prephenate dehydrogenase/arogenate dehydrogenase family protein [Thermoplasmata archaeon]